MNRNQAKFYDNTQVQANTYCFFQGNNLGQPEGITQNQHINRQEAMFATQPGLRNNSEMVMPVPLSQTAYYGHRYLQLLPDTLEENLEAKYMQQYPSLDSFDAIVQGYLNNLSTKKRDKALVDRHRYSIIARVLKEPRNTAISTAQFRFWVKKMFQLVPVGDGTDAVCHDKKPVAMREDIYAILVQAHKQANHGGRDKTSTLARRRYSWIPKELIARFVRHCPFCIARRIGSHSPPNDLIPKAPPGETVTGDNKQQPLVNNPYLGVATKPIIGDRSLDLDWADQSTLCYLPSSPSTTSPLSTVSGPLSTTNFPSCTTVPPSSLGTSDDLYQQHVLISPSGRPMYTWNSSDGQHVEHYRRNPSSSLNIFYSTPSTNTSGNMNTISAPSTDYHHFFHEPCSSKTTFEHGRSIATDHYYTALHWGHNEHQNREGCFLHHISESAPQSNAIYPFEPSPLSTPTTATLPAKYSVTRRPQSAIASNSTYLDHSSPTSVILEEQRQL